MEELFISIDNSIKTGNFYAALFMAITIPSICGALESIDGQDSQDKYVDWYERYMPKSFLTGLDCYSFRCGLLHQGRANFRNDPKQSIRRIIFLFQPGIHNNQINEAIQFNGFIFCELIISGARKWLSEVKNNKNFIKNSTNLITLYPKGLPPYVGGIPVIG